MKKGLASCDHCFFVVDYNQTICTYSINLSIFHLIWTFYKSNMEKNNARQIEIKLLRRSISLVVLAIFSIILLLIPSATASPIDNIISSRQISQQQNTTPPTGEFSYGSTLSRDKWIGLGLAISSSLAIGTSFIITKKGLMDAAERGNGMASITVTTTHIY